MPSGDGKNQTRVSVSDALKRRELLEDFMFWFFDSFVISLLRVCLVTFLDHRFIVMVTLDHFLHYRYLGLSQSGALLSAGRLGTTLWTPHRPSYKWHIWEDIWKRGKRDAQTAPIRIFFCPSVAERNRCATHCQFKAQAKPQSGMRAYFFYGEVPKWSGHSRVCLMAIVQSIRYYRQPFESWSMRR